MWPFIIHEIMQFFTWVFATKAAEFNILILRTLSEITFFYRIIYTVTLTTIAVCCTTRAAIKTTGTILRLFHLIIL